MKIQLISADFSKSSERQCDHCALEDDFEVEGSPPFPVSHILSESIAVLALTYSAWKKRLH